MSKSSNTVFIYYLLFTASVTSCGKDKKMNYKTFHVLAIVLITSNVGKQRIDLSFQVALRNMCHINYINLKL